jgi:hypothetical protein
MVRATVRRATTHDSARRRPRGSTTICGVSRTGAPSTAGSRVPQSAAAGQARTSCAGGAPRRAERTRRSRTQESPRPRIAAALGGRARVERACANGAAESRIGSAATATTGSPSARRRHRAGRSISPTASEIPQRSYAALAGRVCIVFASTNAREHVTPRLPPPGEPKRRRTEPLLAAALGTRVQMCSTSSVSPNPNAARCRRLVARHAKASRRYPRQRRGARDRWPPGDGSRPAKRVCSPRVPRPLALVAATCLSETSSRRLPRSTTKKHPSVCNPVAPRWRSQSEQPHCRWAGDDDTAGECIEAFKP